ncbi:MAG: CPBP family intramembrane metalloprotease [Elusimicrobia bacterium]|nr:CPBP family intramembrane metalloprotease [Elusimicrobiota bacterium]
MTAAAILLLYIAASVGALYWLKPMDPAAALRHMTVMTPIRLLALAAFWTAARRDGLEARFGFEGGARRGLGHAAAMLGLWLIFLTEASGLPWSWRDRLVGAGICVTVGMLEEFAFRGVLLETLSRRYHPWTAALGSSVLFTLYHCRPQSLPAWPHVFLTGVVFAHLRLRGLGLGWLAAIHALVDAAFFFSLDRGVQVYGAAHKVFLTGLFVYAASTVPRVERGQAPIASPG